MGGVMTRTRFHTELVSLFERVAVRAKDVFGEKAQMVKTIEEMGELTRALAKHLNGSLIKGDEIRDEIADVLIMANQMRMYFGPEWIDERMIYKLSRTELYIDKMTAPPPLL